MLTTVKRRPAPKNGLLPPQEKFHETRNIAEPPTTRPSTLLAISLLKSNALHQSALLQAKQRIALSKPQILNIDKPKRKKASVLAVNRDRERANTEKETVVTCYPPTVEQLVKVGEKEARSAIDVVIIVQSATEKIVVKDRTYFLQKFAFEVVIVQLVQGLFDTVKHFVPTFSSIWRHNKQASLCGDAGYNDKHKEKTIKIDKAETETQIALDHDA